MTDTIGNPRKKVGSGKSRTTKTQTPPRKTATASVPAPEEVAEMTAAAIVDSVEQTLAGSVDGKSEKTKVAKSVPVPAPEEAAEKTDELVASLPAVEPDLPTPVPAMAAAQDVQDNDPIGIESEQQNEQKGTPLMADVMETTRKYTEEAKDRFQSAFSEMSEKAKTGVEKSTKAFGELGDIAKGNVEAWVESGRIASKGIEALGQEAAEYGRINFEKASAAMKSLAAVKSPAEFFQVQSELLSTVFDSFAKETAKQSEALLKLAGEVSQPISTRVSVVTEKVRSLAA